MTDKPKTIREAFREVVGPIMKRNPKGRPIDENGKIYLDPTPIAPPLGFKRHKPLYETIREQVRAESLRLAQASEVESFDDADDFRIGDDFDPQSPYEYDFEPPADTPVDPPAPTPSAVPPEGDSPQKPPEGAGAG